jgi:acetyl-CoA C-acetyltransferase
VRVEGACGSGGLGIATGIKSVLSGLAETVLVVGVEVQNTVKAIYGADILAGAGHYAAERKTGHAYFFPAKFSDRAGAYFERYGHERTRKAMAAWYANAIENARLNPLAQEHTNSAPDLMKLGLSKPDPEAFTEHLNFFDCSKVSDGAAAILVCSEEGIAKLGLGREVVCQVAGYGQIVDDLTQQPPDLTKLTTSGKAAGCALAQAGLAAKDVGVFEVHDCFTITGLLALETLGLAEPGHGADLVLSGGIARGGAYPTNTSGGLVGYGHPTGASGVRMAVDLLKQLTGKAGGFQIELSKPTGLLISMGGNDKTVVSVAVKKA